MFEFLDGTGLRVSELSKLEFSRIDFEQNLIFIKEGKGKKDRVVPFGNKIKDKLKIYLSIYLAEITATFLSQTEIQCFRLGGLNKFVKTIIQSLELNRR